MSPRLNSPRRTSAVLGFLMVAALLAVGASPARADDTAGHLLIKSGYNYTAISPVIKSLAAGAPGGTTFLMKAVNDGSTPQAFKVLVPETDLLITTLYKGYTKVVG